MSDEVTGLMDDQEKVIFDEKIERYRIFRAGGLSVKENVYAGLFVGIVIIFIEGINAAINMLMDLGIFLFAIDSIGLLLLLLYFDKLIKKERTDIFKPLVVARGMVGTMEKSLSFKDDKGNEWVAIHFSNPAFFPERKESISRSDQTRPASSAKDDNRVGDSQQEKEKGDNSSGNT